MSQQLKVLMDKRSLSERKNLHTELRNIRDAAMAAGQFSGSRRILASTGAGANTLIAYFDGAIDDYKTVVNSDLNRYEATRLDTMRQEFAGRLREEREAIDQIMENEVGALARHYDPAGLTNYKQIPEAFIAAFEDAKVRASLHNNVVLEGAPTLISVLKAKWENNKFAVGLTGIATLLLIVKGGAEVIKAVKEVFP